MSSFPVFEVSARVAFAGSGSSGEGVMTEISRRGVRVEAPCAQVRPESSVSLAFRFFETSTPIRVPAKVVEQDSGVFAAEFVGLQVVTRHMLRLMLSKLRNRLEGDRSELALLREPR